MENPHQVIFYSGDNPLNLPHCRLCPQPAPVSAPPFRRTLPGILFMCTFIPNASITSFRLRPQETAPSQSGSGLSIEKNRSASYSCVPTLPYPHVPQCPKYQQLHRVRYHPGSGSVNQRDNGAAHTRPTPGAIAAILRRTRPGNSADYVPAAGKFPGTPYAIAPDFFRPEPVRAGKIFGRVPVVAENFPGQSSLALVYTRAKTRER